MITFSSTFFLEVILQARPLRRAPGRARREGSAEEETGADRRSGSSKLRLLRSPGPLQASNAAAASDFMAKTPAPLPLPPPPPPLTFPPVAAAARH